MYKRTLFIGFMLFAMFFGAGNLIFPPVVGQNSGTNFIPAILGFIVTGVGLPLIGVIAGSFSEEGFRTETRRIHPIFSILFMVTIYLTIGPFFAIPRTAMVAHDMGIIPLLNRYSENLPAFLSAKISINFGEILPSFLGINFIINIATSAIVFSIAYFILVFYLALNPTKLVDRIGIILTPLLLLTMVFLIIKSFFVLDTPITEIQNEYQNNPFFKGFIEGYNTMDTIAAVAFSMIVLTAVKATGLENHKDIFKNSCIAAIIAGIGLGLVYLSLGWIGNNYAIDPETPGNLGTNILNAVSSLTYGEGGRFLLSLIVALACLTTAIGLIVAVSSYFNDLYPKISYKVYAVIFTLISLILATFGLDAIINGAIPILLIIYPITIVMIFLVFIDKLFKGLPNIVLRLTILPVVIVSMLTVIYPKTVEFLPFSSSSMQWLIPTLVMFVISMIIGFITKKSSH